MCFYKEWKLLAFLNQTVLSPIMLTPVCLSKREFVCYRLALWDRGLIMNNCEKAYRGWSLEKVAVTIPQAIVIIPYFPLPPCFMAGFSFCFSGLPLGVNWPGLNFPFHSPQRAHRYTWAVPRMAFLFGSKHKIYGLPSVSFDMWSYIMSQWLNKYLCVCITCVYKL